jgi:hypothetical protein
MAITNGLKPIESGGVNFQKTVYNNTSSLSGNKLLYTYAKKAEITTPYGNLFRSFNFPITNNEISTYNNTYQNTALEHLNKDEIIVIEIPKGEYGELIDGKTFKLTLPVTLNSVATSTTVYGSYFGYLGLDANTFIGAQLNKRLSERNENYFGFVPTADNDFNTNVTFLYCNDIQKPKNKGDIVTVLTSTTISVTANSANANKQTISGVSFSTNDKYKITISSTENINDIRVEVDGTNINYNTGGFELINTAGINSVSPKIYQNTQQSSPTPISITIEIQQHITYDLEWDVWSPTNKFPTVEGDESKKIYASYDYTNVVGGAKSPSYDKPVGILFQDKGFAVITDPTLVAGFRYSAGTSSGFNNIASGSPYNGDKNFAKIYFTSSTLSNAQFDSITTEFVQNIICIAGSNEFISSTNSTYMDSYDENTTEKPTFITSIGLYNEARELIGIAKLSEPVKKLPSNIIPFNIKLII